MSNKKAGKKTEQFPDWFNNLLMEYRAGIGHVFLIHGNITDLVPNPDADDEPDKKYISLKEFFKKIFDEREMVIFYNIASGISFLTPQMEAQFQKLLVEPDEKLNPVDAAKAALAKKRGIPREPDTCLPLIEKVLTSQKRVAVIISYVHQIVPAVNIGGGVSVSQSDRVNTVRLASLAQKDALRKNENVVILLADQLTSVSSQVRQNSTGIQTIFIPKPTKEEREVFLQSTRTSQWQECMPKSFDIQMFSLATQGMSYRQILEIFLRCKEAGTKITLEFVKEKKREILNAEYGDLLEIIEPQLGLEDIGGLNHIKTYFKNILDAIQKGEIRLVPMGITLMGPPGTGKTAICEALAKEARFNFVKTKNIRSMWVGESEGRMQTLLYALRSLAPVVVMNDEADQMDSRRDESTGDSGTTNRMRKAWMEFLSDPRIRGQILVINCTNRPDLMDVALKRSGRSDDRIAMLLPSKEERPLIFEVMFKRHKIPNGINSFANFVQETEGLSGADIEKIVLNAYRFAVQNNKNTVDEIALAEAIEDFIPAADQTEIDKMTILAIKECSSRKLLPNNVEEVIDRIKSRALIPINSEMSGV